MAESLGSLFVDIGLNNEPFYRQLADAKAQAFATGTAIEQKIGSIGRTPLGVMVDDSRLFELNKHLDLKVAHLGQVQRSFNANPLKVKVDDSELISLTRKLEDLGRVSTNVRVSATGDVQRQAEQKQTVGNRQLERTIERSLHKLGDRVVKAFSLTSKQSIGQRVGSLVTAPLRAAGSIAANIAVGSLEGMGRELTRDLSKGLSRGLKEELSFSIGSVEGIGEKVGRELIQGILSTLGRDAIAIENALGDILGRENIAKEGAAVRRQGSRRRSQVSRDASEQATIEYEFVKENMPAIQKRGQAVIKKRKNLQKQYESVQSKIDEYAKRLGVEGTEKRLNQIEEEIETANRSAGEAISKGDLKTASKLQAQVKGLVSSRDRFSDAVDAIQKAARERFRALLDEINQADDELLAEERKLGRFGAATDYANILIIPKSRESKSRTVRRAQNPKSAESQNVSAFYSQVANEVADISGVSIPDGLMPKLIAVGGDKLPKGVDAGYSPASNAIYASDKMIEAFASGNVTKQQMNVLVHELRHAVQHGFGTKSIGDSSGVELIKPTFEESRRLGSLIETSTDGNRGISKERSRVIEADAYTFADRNTNRIFHDVRRTQATLRLEDSIGIGGGKLENKLALAQKKAYDAIQRLSKGSGRDVSNEINDAISAIESRAKEFSDSISAIGDIDALPVEEIESLQTKLQNELKSAVASIVNTAKDFSDIANNVPPIKLDLPDTREKVKVLAKNVASKSRGKSLSLGKYELPSDDDLWNPPSSIKHSEVTLHEVEEELERIKDMTASFWKGYELFKESIQVGDLSVVESMIGDIRQMGKTIQSEVQDVIDLAKESGVMTAGLSAELGGQKGQVGRMMSLSDQRVARLRRTNPNVLFSMSDENDEVSRLRNGLESASDFGGDNGVDDIAFAFEDIRKTLKEYAESIRKGINPNAEDLNESLENAKFKASKSAANFDINEAKYQKAEAQINNRAGSASSNLDKTLVGLESGEESLASRVKRIFEADGLDNKLGGVFESLNLKAGGLLGTLLRFGGLAVISGVMGNFATESVQVAIEMEKIGAKLKFIEGSASEAKSSIGELFNESKDLGTDAFADIDGYSRIKAASRGTSLEGYGSEQLFEAGRQASLVYQLDGEAQSRVFTAFEQMISKGNISAEELRQQLSEHLPGAFQIAARSMNVTTAELNKMLERGDVLSSEFLPRFAQQLSSETSSGVAGASKTTQAAINRLGTTMLELKAGFGEELLPFKKWGMEQAAAAIDLVAGNVGILMSGVSLLTAQAFLPLAKGIGSLLVTMGVLPRTLALTSAGMKAAAASTVVFLGKLLILQAAITATSVVWQLFTDASGDMKGIVDSNTKSLDQLIDKLNGVESAADGARTSLEAQGAIGGIKKTLDGFDSIGKTLNDSRTGQFFQNLTGSRMFAEPEEGKNGSLVNWQIRRQEEALTERFKEGSYNSRRTIDQSASYLTGPNRSYIDSFNATESKLQQVQLQMQASRVLRPGSTEEMEMLRQQEEELLKSRSKQVEAVGDLRASVESQIQFEESRQAELSEQLKNNAISQESYNEKMAESESLVRKLKTTQEAWNNALDKTANNLAEISRKLIAASDALNDAKFFSTNDANEYRAQIARGEQGGLTPGQVESANRLVDQQSLRAQMAAQQKAIDDTQRLLQSKELQEGVSQLGADAFAGPSRLATLRQEFSEKSPKIEGALDALIQLRELEGTASELQLQIEQSSAEASKQLRETTREINELFRTLANESANLALDTQRITNSGELARQTSKVKSAMIGFSKSFISDFGDSLIAVVEAFNEPLQNAIDAQQSILAAQQGYLSQAMGIDAMRRGLPGMGGMQFAGGGGAGSGTILGVTGNTGRSTGPHLDVRYGRDYAPDRPRPTDEHLNRLLIDGVPLTQMPLTSEHRSRNASRPGHDGVDFGTAVGQTITSAVPIESVSQPVWDENGGGWYTSVKFTDGVVLNLLHLDPSSKNAGVGTGGTPVASAAASGGGARGAGGVPRLSSGYGALNELAPKLTQSSRFDTATPAGRAALAIALGIGGTESLGEGISRRDFFTLPGGTGGNMKGFAQFNQKYHAGNTATPGRYTDFLGSILHGSAAQPNGRSSRDFAGELAQAIQSGSVKTGQQLISWMQSSGLGGSNWQGIDDGWHRSPELADQLVRYLQQGGSGGGAAPTQAARDTKYGYSRQEVARYVTAIENDQKLAPEAASAYKAMDAAANAAGLDLRAISGFRDLKTQEYLWNRQIQRRGSPEAAAEFSAPPGYSNHHTGNAIDIGSASNPGTDLQRSFENTPEFKWLEKNAASFGFEMPYYKGNNNGAGYEPWEWKYTGGSPINGIPGTRGGSAGGLDGSAINAQGAMFNGQLDQAELQAASIRDGTIANIEETLRQQNVLSELNMQIAKQASIDGLTESRRQISEKHRGENRRLMDLGFEALPGTPNNELNQALEGNRRGLEDDLLSQDEYRLQLEQTIEQATMMQQFIPGLGLDPAYTAEVLAKLGDVLVSANWSLAEADSREHETIMRYKEIENKLLEEFRLAEESRKLAARQKTFEIDSELVTAGFSQSMRIGEGRYVAEAQFNLAVEALEIEFDQRVLELETMVRDELITAEEAVSRRLKYEQIGELNFASLGIGRDQSLDQLTRSENSALFDAQRGLAESIMRNYSMVGGTPWQASGNVNIEKELALMQQQFTYDSQLHSYRQTAQTEGHAPGKVAEVESLLARANESEIANIGLQFNKLKDHIDAARGATEGLFESLLTGTMTAGEALGAFLTNIAASFAKLAAQKLTDSLFGALLGGTSGTGAGGGFAGLMNMLGFGGGRSAPAPAQASPVASIGGGFISSLLGSIGGGGGGGSMMSTIAGKATKVGGFAGSIGRLIGLRDGGTVPHMDDGGTVQTMGSMARYYEGFGEISAALKREGPNAVLAALTPEEEVLSVSQARRFRQMGLDQVLNFRDGGTVGSGASFNTSSVKMHSSNSYGGVAVTVPVNVAMTSSGDTKADNDRANRLGDSLRDPIQALVRDAIAREQGPRGMLSK